MEIHYFLFLQFQFPNNSFLDEFVTILNRVYSPILAVVK
jgi:hypothetical protein